MKIIIFKNWLLAAFARTDLKNLKFQVKTDETELIGIDLKSVSLKRQIKNDAQTEVISLIIASSRQLVENVKIIFQGWKIWYATTYSWKQKRSRSGPKKRRIGVG